MITYRNDWSNYPDFTNLPSMGFSYRALSNPDTQISGYVATYTPFGKVLSFDGTQWSGILYTSLNNSSTPENFTYSARFSYSGVGGVYTDASATNSARLFWHAKRLNGTTQTAISQGYTFIFNAGGANNMQLQRTTNAGALTAIDTNTWTFANIGNPFDFTAKVIGSGSYFECYINDTVVASGTDTNIPRNGIFGFGMRLPLSAARRTGAVGLVTMEDNFLNEFNIV